MSTTSQGEIIVQDFAGQNNQDNPFIIDDTQATVASNVIVTNRAVEIRGGFELYSQSPDENATGGIPMQCKYTKRDGTTQLIFAHQNKYYFNTPEDQTWNLIGTYGTEVENPYAFQYKDVIVFGTGKIGNKSYKYDAVANTYTANTIAFVDSGPDTITDSANGLGGFRQGDILIVTGSASNDGQYTIAGVAPGVITLIASDSLVNEAAGPNFTLKSSGMSLVSVPANTLCDLRFFGQFSGKDIRYLMGAGDTSDDPDKNQTSLYFTDNPNNWATANSGVMQIGPSDGTDITGILQKDNLVVYKEKSKHYLDSFYADFTGTFALKEFGVENSSGSPNHETLNLLDADIISLTQKGKSIEGFGLEGTAAGNSRPKQYGTYINPIINTINWDGETIKKARGHNFNRLELQAVPYNGSPVNNVILVGHWDTPTNNGQPSWTTWLRSAGSFETFEDASAQDILTIGDSLQPRIYKYNPNTYSDNTFGYRRVWRSKMYSLGRRNDYNDLKHIIISGYIKRITKFKLRIIVDGRVQEYFIDKDQIFNEGSDNGALIGDKLIGSETIGGNSLGDDKFRYLAIAQVPNALRYCKNVSVELSNEAAGQYWSMDYLSINEIINLNNIPANHKNLKSA